MIIALPLLLTLQSPPESNVVVDGLAQKMAHSLSALQDVEATFHRHEWLRGSMRNPETMIFKWRKSGDVHMKWLAGDAKGREILWRRGWKEMKVKDLLTIDLDPASWLVFRESRHTIFDAGIAKLARFILDDAERARRVGGVKTTLLPKRKIHGAPASCWLSEQPKAQHPEFYAARAEICVDDAHGLPIYARLWNVEDGALRVVEEYSYADVRLNAGLGETAFAPDWL